MKAFWNKKYYYDSQKLWPLYKATNVVIYSGGVDYSWYQIYSLYLTK